MPLLDGDFDCERLGPGRDHAGQALPELALEELRMRLEQRARQSISRRNHLRLWLAPFRFENRSVWIDQVSRDIGIKATTHVIDPQVDLTREHLLHSLIGEGFVDRFGFVKGSAVGTPSKPRFNLTGDRCHGDGNRLVVILSREPIAADHIRSLLGSSPPRRSPRVRVRRPERTCVPWTERRDEISPRRRGHPAGANTP
jgi:hypothetical protein